MAWADLGARLEDLAGCLAVREGAERGLGLWGLLEPALKGP